MKICYCERCRYMFPSAFIPETCPDCGGKKIRHSNRKEVLEYKRIQKIIQEEIRLGVIPG